METTNKENEKTIVRMTANKVCNWLTANGGDAEWFMAVRGLRLSVNVEYDFTIGTERHKIDKWFNIDGEFKELTKEMADELFDNIIQYVVGRDNAIAAERARVIEEKASRNELLARIANLECENEQLKQQLAL